MKLQSGTVAVVTGAGSGMGHFRTPWGIAVDSDGRLLVADTGNRRIAVLRTAGRE